MAHLLYTHWDSSHELLDGCLASGQYFSVLHIPLLPPDCRTGNEEGVGGFLRDGQGKVGDTWARVGHDILNLAATGVTLRGANIHDY